VKGGNIKVSSLVGRVKVEQNRDGDKEGQTSEYVVKEELAQVVTRNCGITFPDEGDRLS